MSTIPLLAHQSPHAALAYRGGGIISAGRFLQDAAALAERLPAGAHVLNLCCDRYRFAVGLAACLMTERISLLPPTHTPEVISQMAGFAPDAFCLTDDPRCEIGIAKYAYPAEIDAAASRPGSWAVPAVPAMQIAAIVFTSGSTGTPVPYKKTWGRLARCVRDGAPRLGLLDGRSHVLLGTVPPQHMYGFESTVLLALLSGNALAAERPFFPAEVAAGLAALPQPRVLVTTPVHLRTLLISGVHIPSVDLVVSATAPLPLEIAQQVEAQLATQLIEIYGSTETGQVASRRSTAGPAWKLWPDVKFSASQGQIYAHGGHVEQFTPMGDVIELIAADEFLLHGRSSDLINIAGKRSSFSYLNAQLNGIPGVLDGAFFLREAASGNTGVARVGAVVVAPNLTVAALTAQLRRRIDPVFLPRPLIIVERLPRNDTGKLPQHEIEMLASRHLQADDAS